jgi:hypothetical protein
MEIDAKTFFILVATLAVGGAGGYVASEKHLLPPLEPKPEPAPIPVPMPPVSVPLVVDAGPPPAATPSVIVPPAPACDDMAGMPGDCPPPGFPAFEGGCGSFAATRCAEFKQGMKPKVATEAVACLAKLTPQDRCSAQRVNLCGHVALMNACPEPDSAGADAAAAAATGVAALCKKIAATCSAASSVTISESDCERTLAGMTPVGRDRTAACLKKHCLDKGLLLCEEVAHPD